MPGLNALAVQRAKATGRYGDGGGLYLQVSKGVTKTWIFRFMLNGRSREMGLGSTDLVTLADARAKALACRRLLLDGIDPIDARKERRNKLALETARSITFDQCAKSYLDAHRGTWRNAKHVWQWENTLERHVSPVFGALPVQSIDTALVMRVIEPLWPHTTETASRLRGRIEVILDWAIARQYRGGPNPARWKGHLSQLLPRRSSVRAVKHLVALPISEIGSFMFRLRKQSGVAAQALEFLILTAARTGEVIGAQWTEFDLEKSVWIIPPERMKAKRQHRVPLSPRAIEILSQMRRIAASSWVFPGARPGKPLSNMAMLELVRGMKVRAVVHGFRSTFRDWAAEQTNYSREVAEFALAHTITNKVEAAYRRGDLLLKRQCLMNDWANFCNSTSELGALVEFRPQSSSRNIEVIA